LDLIDISALAENTWRRSAAAGKSLQRLAAIVSTITTKNIDYIISNRTRYYETAGFAATTRPLLSSAIGAISQDAG